MAGIRQNNFTGYVIDEWEIGEYLGMNKYACTCHLCGNVSETSGYAIQTGTVTRCKCQKRVVTDLTGKVFGNWTVIELLQQPKVKGVRIIRKWTCRCTCGVVRNVCQGDLVNGKSTGCGHDTNRQFIDLTGKQYGDWAVIEYVPEKMKWKCRCSCGSEGILSGYALRDGLTKSCGHSTTGFHDMTGEQFGEWTVLKKSEIQMSSGGTNWTCQCSCGTIRDLDRWTLLKGITRSCGCKTQQFRAETCMEKYGVKHPAQAGTTRTPEQLKMIDSREDMIATIGKNFTTKPTIYELTQLLGLDRGSVKGVIHKYKLEDIVILGTQPISGYEKWLNSLFPCDYVGDRSALGGQELDLYYPESEFAIEFNGNYWHSEIKKPKNYHRNKTMSSASRKIQLLHIFEYEWLDKTTREKIVNLIRYRLHPEELNVLQARKCSVGEIDSAVAKEFINKYHLQGATSADVSIGMLDESNQLIGVMTFGKPRFNENYECELIRLAWKDGIAVTGGIEKLFAFFNREYAPKNIICYCNIAKFTGNSYIKIGFKVKGFTEPNYRWVDVETNENISRYQTTKKKLLAQGFGNEGQTEADIMHDRGYTRVYDSGNLVLDWYADESKRPPNKAGEAQIRMIREEEEDKINRKINKGIKRIPRDLF